MSEEIKKEAQDVELNPEELKQVSGGFTNHDKCEERFIISEEEMEKIRALNKEKTMDNIPMWIQYVAFLLIGYKIKRIRRNIMK